MTLQTVYCSKDIFEDIVLSENDANELGILYKVLRDYSNVVIDINEDEFLDEIKNNAFYKAFIKREASEFITLPDFFNNLEEENLENFPTDVFLVDKPIEFTSGIRANKGILVLNSGELDIINKMHQPLTCKFSKGSKGKFSAWTELFDSKDMHPINSAVIIDNYLFNDYQVYRSDNLLKILTSLIPRDLSIPFHLTLLYENNEVKYKQERVVNIIKDLKGFIVRELGIDIEIGIIAFIGEQQFHHRAILTNNYFISSDRGFNIFIGDHIKNDSFVRINWVYDSVCTELGEILKKIHSDYLEEVKKVIAKCMRIESNLIFAAGHLENRLLN